MRIEITSTTDTPENVQAALGNKVPAKTEPGKEAAPKESHSAAPKEEPKATAKSDPAGTEDESETDDAKGLEAGDGSEADGEKDDNPKKVKGGWQRRIDKKTREAADARREADYWKSQALKGAAGDKPQSQGSETVKTESKGEPQAGEFDTHAAYVKALANWTADQKLDAYKKEQQTKAQESQQSTALKAHFDRVEAFKEKTADYDDVLGEAENMRLSDAIAELVISSDLGPAIIYELAKNTEELDRLNRLSPLAAAREMGKLEARLAKPSDESKTETKKTTKAPKPLDPVGSRGASVDKDIYDAANMTQKEYERARAKQRAEAAKAG